MTGVARINSRHFYGRHLVQYANARNHPILVLP